MNRREFLKSGSMFAATAGMAGCATATAALAGKKEIKVAVVGCGGRGTGGMWKPANAQDFYKFAWEEERHEPATITEEEAREMQELIDNFHW